MNDQTEAIETQTETKPVVGKRIKRMKVAVTQKEIDEAHRGKSNKCMMQEAIKRDHPDFKAISVDKNYVRITDPKANVIYTFQMPAFGKTMMLLWDDGQDIKPYDVWFRDPVVRERKLIGGALRPKESYSKKHDGPVPRALTKEARVQRGARDRIWGQKLWTDELTKLRKVLEPIPAKASAPQD